MLFSMFRFQTTQNLCMECIEIVVPFLKHRCRVRLLLARTVVLFDRQDEDLFSKEYSEISRPQSERLVENRCYLAEVPQET
ncbi:hypothetical protein X975_16505, partial [Stegodyphus mimosarum]